MTIKLFKGLEVEGPLTGLPTLFVQGDVPIEAILKQCTIFSNQYGNCFQVYFGAGRMSLINKDSLYRTLNFVDFATAVTVESVDDYNNLFQKHCNIHQMLTITMPELGEKLLFPPEVVKVARSTLSNYYVNLSKDQKNRIFVKLDSGHFIFVCTLEDFRVNDYSSYQNDVLIQTF